MADAKTGCLPDQFSSVRTTIKASNELPRISISPVCPVAKVHLASPISETVFAYVYFAVFKAECCGHLVSYRLHFNCNKA